MYSYAERMRAVQLGIIRCKRVGATLRELGYPTQNSLWDWYREYERPGNLTAQLRIPTPGCVAPVG